MNGQQILKYWNKVEKMPLGRFLFSVFVSKAVPYSGTIHSKVLKLSPGYCLLELKDRKVVRNHLNSIHAIALCNLGELCSGLAMLCCLDEKYKSIVTHLEIEYLKKSRGTLLAECQIDPIKLKTRLESEDNVEEIVSAHIKDESGDTTALLKAKWRVAKR